MMKTVLISGASRGIGAAAALRFAAAGYAVAVNYRADADGAAAVVREIMANGGEAVAFCADVADAAAVEAMVNAVTARFGRIDVLVHNAGHAHQALFTDTTPDEWRRMMAVHLDGAYHLAHAVVPPMVARHEGRILTVSSMWGQVGASCEVAYSAAKAGLIGFTKALAKEVGYSGVRVNCVSPGVVDTQMNAHFSKDDLALIQEEIPCGRMGTGEEVAAAVVFLTENEYVNGVNLSVNGGFSIV